MATISQSETITGTGAGSIAVKPNQGVFNIAMTGGAATIKIQKAHVDANTVWYDISKNVDGDVASYAISSSSISVDLYEASGEWIYRVNCTSYTSDVTVRVTQK